MSELIHHRDVGESDCDGLVASGRELFQTDFWCVYCGAKFDTSEEQNR